MRFGLTLTKCENLRAEINRGYQRLLRHFAGGRLAQTVEEAEHCRALVELCDRYATGAPDRAGLRALKPLLILLQTEARVIQEVDSGRVEDALYHTDRALDDLLDHYCAHASVRAYDQAHEAQTLHRLYDLLARYCVRSWMQGTHSVQSGAEALERLRSELGRLIGTEPQSGLRSALRIAVAQERFEEAARLRDQLGEKRVRRV